jgi:hypothetical protein
MYEKARGNRGSRIPRFEEERKVCVENNGREKERKRGKGQKEGEKRKKSYDTYIPVFKSGEDALMV